MVKWALPLAASIVFFALLAGSLLWAADRSDDIAQTRQKDLLTLIVSNMRDTLAHNQESATVWDDAVHHVATKDLDWIALNLGQWMFTYFDHDAAVITTSEGVPIYEYIAPSSHPVAKEALSKAYRPLATILQKRLAAGDTKGVTDHVLSIGESDITFVDGRPAIVSVKPIVTDSGDIEQTPGKEYLHIAFRFLDDSFPAQVGRDYQFEAMEFSVNPPDDLERSSVQLVSRTGEVIGYFTWLSFEPGESVLKATLPAVGLFAIAVFLAVHLAGIAILRRSMKLTASRQELQHLALHDPLTGLANRAHFNSELTARLGSAAADDLHTVLFVDLDRFKAVNDTFGHPTGDKLIAEVAKRMRAMLPGTLIGRIGGDEFTLLLKGADNLAVAAICDRIVHCLREPYEIDGIQVVIGASVGAASTTGRAEALEITRRADIALYHAKAAGRNTFAIFGGHMDELLRNRRELEHDLRLALETRTQIETYYQPVYSTEDQTLSSMEALARWRHPVKGYVPPDVFIPIAEEIGLIHEIGAIILENACSVLAEHPSITVAVNASALELNAVGYPVRVLSALNRWSIAPSRLEIEITESLAMGSGGLAETNIATLREAGVRFAIDDFGTGYSSFSRMQNIKVDRIKIDKSFIDAMEQGESRGLVEAMIGMAHARGLKITAEGVETSQQSDTLKTLGCDNLQGFLLCQPLPRAALLALVRGSSIKAGAA